MARVVQYSPCSVAELFLRGVITDDDILPSGGITDSTRLRAERNYTEIQPPAIPRSEGRRPDSARPRSSARPLGRRPDSARPSRPEPRHNASQVGRVRARRDVEDKEYTPRAMQMDNCCICLTAVKQHACVPCYHMCICSRCKDRVSHCPLCRTAVQRVVRIFW